MAKKKSKHFSIRSGQSANSAEITIDPKKRSGDEKVHVNLRYFQKANECFSAWQQAELKSFSNWLEKMSSRTVAQVTSTTQTCHAHVGITKQLPLAVSLDVKMYGLDVGKKARVHGFFVGNDFFLVWLDRNHNILK